MHKPTLLAVAALASLSLAGCSQAPEQSQPRPQQPTSSPASWSGCTITRRVVDPALGERVTLDCEAGQWVATRDNGRRELHPARTAVDGWRLTSAETGPGLLEKDIGVAVVLTLTHSGGRTCEVQSVTTAGQSETRPAQSTCLEFDSTPTPKSA